MTWDEFKDFVDKELQKQGIKGSIEIDYIDIRTPNVNYDVSCPEVGIDEYGISVYN